jgi:DNA-binding CsgD family transcriptional regulator
MKTSGESASRAFAKLFDDVDLPPDPVEFPAEQDEETILSHLRFAEQLFPSSGISLCPVSHPKIRYHSASCEHILGHPHKRLMQMSLSEFYDLVHPEDLAALQQCYAFVGAHKTDDPEAQRYSIYYRIKTSTGEFVPIRNDQLAIRIRENSYLYLLTYNSIAAEEKFYHVRLDLYRKINGAFVKIDSYNPQQGKKEITPRQNDIVTLVKKGFSNREIADKLGISIYTVKNHKQMLFRKISVKSSIEMVNYVERN